MTFNIKCDNCGNIFQSTGGYDDETGASELDIPDCPKCGSWQISIIDEEPYEPQPDEVI